MAWKRLRDEESVSDFADELSLSFDGQSHETFSRSLGYLGRLGFGSLDRRSFADWQGSVGLSLIPCFDEMTCQIGLLQDE